MLFERLNSARHWRGRVATVVFAATSMLPSLIALAEEGSQRRLEEIIVTAQKRPQAFREVGITLDIFREEELDNLNLVSLPEAASVLPNVELFEDFSGSGSPTWVIRGVGLQDFNSNNTPTASVYVDEVYQSSTVMGDVGLYDVERLEVLKGPQGGLYGRNTTGGAVLLRTRRADLERVGGYLEAGYGSWQTKRGEAALNLPLDRNSALRVAGRMEDRDDAWQRSLSDRRTHGEKRRWDLRTWLLHQPSENLRIEWKLQGGEDNSDIMLGRSVALYAPTGELCEPVLSGRRDPVTCLNFAGVNKRSAGQAAEHVGWQSDDGSLVLSDTINRQKNDYFGTILQVAYDLPWGSIMSISSVDTFNYGVDLDLDASQGEYGHRLSSSDIANYSQEFRLLSNGDGRLDWLVGLTLGREEFDENRDFLLRDNRLVGLGQGQLHYNQETAAHALFATVTYRITSGLSLDLGGRYSDIEKTYVNGNFYIPSDPPQYFIRNVSGDYQLDNPWSGRIGITWHINDATTFYASASRGFKSGGFFGGFPFSPDEVRPYEEEVIVAYEAGVNKTWPSTGTSLRAAAFYYDYRDVQGFISETNPVTGTVLDRLGNQGDAEHAGGELALTWLPMDSPFRVELAAGYLDAMFESSNVLTSGMASQYSPITGRRPYAPRWSTNLLLGYQWTMGTGLQGDATLNYHYRSAFSGHHSSPADRAVNHLPGYGLWNSRLELRPSGGSWTVAVWAKNLLDKTYRTRVKHDGLMSYVDFFGEPRSAGLEFRYDF